MISGNIMFEVDVEFEVVVEFEVIVEFELPTAGITEAARGLK